MTRIRRALIACAVAFVAPPAAPAGAHSGGRAQLYVESVHLEPRPDGWRADLVLRDADSGKAEPGFGVQLSAAAADGRVAGPVALADPDADGRYAGDLPLTEGAWTVSVEAAEIPGGAQGLPFQRTWPANLRTGQPTRLGASSPPSGGRGGGGKLPAVPIGLGVLAVVALGAGVVSLRRASTVVRA